MSHLRSQIMAFLQGRMNLLRRFGWSEVALLSAALIVLICSYCFIKLVDEMKEGDTQTVDDWH